MTNGTLIVGAGQAGVQIAVSLRDGGYGDAITIVGSEAHPPYSRPPLSKEFLAGEADQQSLELRTADFYTAQRIDVLTSERIIDLGLSDSAGDGSGVAITESGRALPFDKLALTTGSRPRRLNVPGTDLPGVLYLRVVEDAHALKLALASANDVVVIGGGFIGLEAAAAARSAGKRVTVLEAADRLVARSVAPVVSQFLFDAHTRRGIDLYVNAEVVRINGENRVRSVELTDGVEIPSDLVIVGVGIMPRAELAEKAGLECDRGIVVDGYARTSNGFTVAAGDCTVLPNPLTGQGRYRLESTQNAMSQARTAAATLLGRSELHDSVPWFWSDQFDLKLQIAGLTDGYDDHVVRGDPRSDSFSVVYFKAGALLAVDSVNRPADYLAVRTALARKATIDRALCANPAVALKQLIVPLASVTAAPH